MDVSDLQILMNDIKAAEAMIDVALQEPKDEEHRRKTRWAKGFIEQKKHVLRGILHRRSLGSTKEHKEKQEERNRRRSEFLTRSRASLNDGDLASALSIVLDFLEGK